MIYYTLLSSSTVTLTQKTNFSHFWCSPYPLCSKKKVLLFCSCCSCSCFLILFPFFLQVSKATTGNNFCCAVVPTSTISNIFLLPPGSQRKEVVNLLFALADNTTEKVKLGLGSCSKIPLFHQCWQPMSNPKQNKRRSE